MAKLACLVVCDLLVTLDTGFVRGPVCPRDGLFMDNVPMTVNTSELELLNMEPMGDSYVVGNLFLFGLDPFVTADAVVVDEFIFR